MTCVALSNRFGYDVAIMVGAEHPNIHEKSRQLQKTGIQWRTFTIKKT